MSDSKTGSAGKEEKKKETPSGLSLDDTDLSGNLKLTSKDKKEFEVSKKAAFISNLVKTSLDTDASATEVPIPGVASNVLALVVEYMNHHNGSEPPIIEKPLRSKVMKDVCKDAWDAEFIDKISDDRQKLYDLILAANYLDIKGLLHLGCAKVASLIKGQPLEKIKEILSKGMPAAPAAAAAAAAAAPAAPAAAAATAAAAPPTKDDKKQDDEKKA